MQTWQKKLPMQMTWARMALVPVVVALLFPGQVSTNIAAACLFIVASITDYYDGYFARKFNATSNLGKFMDPIADKILVTSVLVMLANMERIDPVMVIVILARDQFISGIRMVASADGLVIDAKAVGKWKTALQMIAIPAVMIGEPVDGLPFDKIGYYVLWFSVILSVTSGVQYYLAYLKSQKTKSRP
jgi:CDP-diacylglycerol--glycerol-3-phosphate 3-phosphatidyltransferase